MRVVLITGVCGEVGQALAVKLKTRRKKTKIIGLDISSPDRALRSVLDGFYNISITQSESIEKIIKRFSFDTVFHLASVLSTGAEKDPHNAHRVNVEGMANLLHLLETKGRLINKKVKFIFPSSIAVYGMRSLKEKQQNPKVSEDEFTNPITMYGVNKLYCETLGQYYAFNFKLLENKKRYIDFRCVRFPGLLSADTIPSGGTSDYGSEMIHMSAQGKKYNCFVREDATISFMAMPDAVRSLLEIAKAPGSKLNQSVYNVSGFSVSAKDIKDIVEKKYKNAQINYAVDKNRQKIVDSWPEDVNDKSAKDDWGWKPQLNFKDTFQKYLFPKIDQKYKTLT